MSSDLSKNTTEENRKLFQFVSGAIVKPKELQTWIECMDMLTKLVTDQSTSKHSLFDSHIKNTKLG